MSVRAWKYDTPDEPDDAGWIITRTDTDDSVSVDVSVRDGEIVGCLVSDADDRILSAWGFVSAARLSR